MSALLIVEILVHEKKPCHKVADKVAPASNICIIPVEFYCLIYLIMRIIRELCRFVRVRGFGENFTY
jgi:hypothetical protein